LIIVVIILWASDVLCSCRSSLQGLPKRPQIHPYHFHLQWRRKPSVLGYNLTFWLIWLVLVVDYEVVVSIQSIFWEMVDFTNVIEGFCGGE